MNPNVTGWLARRLADALDDALHDARLAIVSDDGTAAALVTRLLHAHPADATPPAVEAVLTVWLDLSAVYATRHPDGWVLYSYRPDDVAKLRAAFAGASPAREHAHLHAGGDGVWMPVADPSDHDTIDVPMDDDATDPGGTA